MLEEGRLVPLLEQRFLFVTVFLHDTTETNTTQAHGSKQTFPQLAVPVELSRKALQNELFSFCRAFLLPGSRVMARSWNCFIPALFYDDEIFTLSCEYVGIGANKADSDHTFLAPQTHRVFLWVANFNPQNVI